MKCVNCGKEIPSIGIYCPKCGLKVRETADVNQDVISNKIDENADNRIDSNINNNTDTNMENKEDDKAKESSELSETAATTILKNPYDDNSVSPLLQMLQEKNENKDEYERIKVQKEAEAKKKARIFKLIVFAVVVLIIVLIAADIKKKNDFRKKLRNMAVEEMEQDYTNVYIDAIMILPVYTIEVRNFYGKNYSAHTKSVICQCITVEGEEVWAEIPSDKYPEKEKNEYSLMGTSYEYYPCYYSSDDPLRITGEIETAHDVDENFYSEIGDVLVLDARDVPEKQ